MLGRLFSFVGNGILFIIESFLTLLFKLRYALTLLVAFLLAFKVAELSTLVLGPSFIPFGIAAICIPFCYLIHLGFNYFLESRPAREGQLDPIARPHPSLIYAHDEFFLPNIDLPRPILNNFGHINNREIGYNFNPNYTEPTPMGQALRDYVTRGMPFRL